MRQRASDTASYQDTDRPTEAERPAGLTAVAPRGERVVKEPPRTDAGLDAIGNELRAGGARLLATLVGGPARRGARALKVGEWEAQWAILNVVDLRPANFTTDDGGGEQPFDSATPRALLQRYKSFDQQRAYLMALAAAIKTEQTHLANRLRPAISPAHETAKGVANIDVTAAAALKPAADYHGASASSRKENQRAQRLAEEGMSESDIAAVRVEQASRRKQKVDARQAAREARAAKKK